MRWPAVPLREIAPPKASTQPFPDSFVWHLSLEQIEGDTGAVLAKNYDYSGNAGSSTFYFDTGNVLYSKLRPYLNKVVVPDEPGIATTELIPLRPDPKVLNPRYLAFYLRSPNFVKQASHHIAGAKMPRVVMDWFWKHKIPLPPLSEQERIVEILDEADRIRNLRREANQKAEKIIPALFLNMFGDPETNPKGWKIKHIKDVVLSTDYGTSSKASSDGLGLPIIRMGNIDYEGKIDLKDLKYVQLEHSEIERLSLKAGDILFNRTNSKKLVGKTGLWEGGVEAVPASYFIRVRVNPDIIIPCFFWAFMNSSHMKKLHFSTARGAIGQANINSRELKDFSIFIPPIDKQQLFKNMLEKLKSLIHHRNQSLIKSENLFSMLLKQSLSGRK